MRKTNASKEFVNKISNANDVFTATVKEENLSYIILAFEKGDINRMVSISSIPPATMFDVLAYISENIGYDAKDVEVIGRH